MLYIFALLAVMASTTTANFGADLLKKPGVKEAYEKCLTKETGLPREKFSVDTIEVGCDIHCKYVAIGYIKDGKPNEKLFREHAINENEWYKRTENYKPQVFDQKCFAIKATGKCNPGAKISECLAKSAPAN